MAGRVDNDQTGEKEGAEYVVLLVDTPGMLGSFMGRISRRFWRLRYPW